MKISTAKTVTENKLKIILSGVSGSGKTTAVKSLKDAGFNPLIISFESGLLSIAGADIDYIDGTKDDNGAIIPKELRVNRLSEAYKFILSDEAKKKYDTIFVDSLTEISQCMFDFLRKEYPERKDNLVLYGDLGQKMRDAIKAFRDVPHYHVVKTCLTKIEKDENAKRYMGFDLIGSISDKLPQFYDEVIYIRVKDDGTREYVCNPTDSVIAKDRSGKLSATEPADLGAIFHKILGTTKTEKGENKNV